VNYCFKAAFNPISIVYSIVSIVFIILRLPNIINLIQ